MILALALVAFGQAAVPQQDPKIFVFSGETVTLSAPPPTQDASPTQAVASWTGWNSLGGSAPVFDAPFMGTGNWADVVKTYVDDSSKPAAQWRVKIVLLASADTLLTTHLGILDDRRNSITGDRFVGALNSIAQFIALVSATTDGKVKIVPDVLIDPEPSRDTAVANRMDFDSAYLNGYLRSRINGGSYEADHDSKFRGPFNSVLFLDPCDHGSVMLLDPSARVRPGVFKIDATPAAEVSFDSAGGGSAAGALAISLFDAWTATVSARSTAIGLPVVAGDLKSLDWASLANTADPPTDVLLKRLATHPSTASKLVELPPDLRQPAYKTANIAVSIAQDPAKGPVLEYAESKATRFGGFALPHGAAPIDTDKTPSLTVTYKTSSDRPVSLALEAPNGFRRWVSLGREREADNPDFPKAVSMPLQSDGAWHSVTIDLHALGAKSIDQIRLGASPSAAVLTTELPAPVVYDFAEFRLGSDAPTPPLPEPTADHASADPQSRSLAALDLDKAGQPSPDLAALLKDPDESVELNAAAAYQTVKDPFAEATLIDLSKSPAPRVAEMALRALDHQGTATAAAAIKAQMLAGFEYSREIAATLIGAKHDPSSAPDLAVLVAGRLWHTRLAAVLALAELPGEGPGRWRLGMIDQDDPMIKCAVIENTDIKSDDDMRKLLWSAVNEPSDRVRAESCEKLIQSSLPNMRTEGLKGVRDDSWWTRVLILDFLQQNPLEDARSAIKLDLKDASPEVRTAAIRALAALPQVTIDEVQPCLMDADPGVDKALIALAKAHKLDLPAATLALFKSSPDPTVAAAVGS